jgi:hypothetical protein
MILKNEFRSMDRNALVRMSCFVLLTCYLVLPGCYSFKDVSIPAEAKTFKVELFANKSSYVNPLLAPQLTDKLRQKISNQTRLSPVQNDPHYDISCTITSYSVTTSAISQQQAATNRLTVGVHLTVKYSPDEKKNIEADVSRNFEFSSGLTLQQAEPQLMSQILPQLTDEIFNRIFSNW